MANIDPKLLLIITAHANDDPFFKLAFFALNRAQHNHSDNPTDDRTSSHCHHRHGKGILREEGLDEIGEDN